MLVLMRREGQWLEVTHRSGDVLRIRIYDVHVKRDSHCGRIRMAFDDDAHNFIIDRPESDFSRRLRAAEAGEEEG